jgi:thioredoxin reductase (NADPH)
MFSRVLSYLFLLVGAVHLYGEPLVYDCTKIVDKASVIPVLVVGGGPAGLSAAVYCSRDGYHTVVVEGPLPGGQITETGDVENCPGVKKMHGGDIMLIQRQQAEEAGVTLLSGSVTALNLNTWPFVATCDDGTTLRACAVVIATGAQAKTLNIPGERMYWGCGVSICAVCDAWAFNNKRVVVIGGGDSAAEQALQLSLHAQQVTLLVRGSSLRASTIMQQKLARVPTITIEYHKEVREIVGNGQEVTGIIIADTRTEQPGNTVQTEQRAIDGVFLAIGHLPRNELVVGQLDLDEHGCIHVAGRSQVALRNGQPVPGVCAAGEIADHEYRQLAVAFGDGSKAGKDIQRFLYSIGLTPQELRAWRTIN